MREMAVSSMLGEDDRPAMKTGGMQAKALLTYSTTFWRAARTTRTHSPYQLLIPRDFPIAAHCVHTSVAGENPVSLSFGPAPAHESRRHRVMADTVPSA